MSTVSEHSRPMCGAENRESVFPLLLFRFPVGYDGGITVIYERWQLENRILFSFRFIFTGHIVRRLKLGRKKAKEQRERKRERLNVKNRNGIRKKQSLMQNGWFRDSKWKHPSWSTAWRHGNVKNNSSCKQNDEIKKNVNLRIVVEKGNVSS